jgi:acyl dehydratase
VVLGLAPWHGRLLVLDRDDAAESTGHGSPLPMLVHGGPGRAGGGEEMGGIRGVLHYMQRTAVQASPRVLSAITGRWTAGAERNADGGHPFRKSLADLRIGDTVVAGPRRVTLADIEHFAEFTGDTFYAHMDDEAARANPFFDGRVAHGYLIVSFAAGLFVQPDPGPVLANYGLENLRFLTPVYPDDELTVTLTCKQITPREDAEHGEVRWDADVTNQEGKSVASYDVLTLVAKQWPVELRIGQGQAERDRVAVAERLAVKGAADVSPAHGHVAGKRAHDHAEQLLVARRAAHDEDLAEARAEARAEVRAEVRAERADGPPEVGGQDCDLQPEPYRPPLGWPVAAVEGQQAAGPVDGEHPGRRGGSRGGEETVGAVLGFEPLAAVHSYARAALDPVGGRPGYAERLGHRRGEQVAGARGHHSIRAPDYVDGACSQVDDERAGTGARRGEGSGPGRRRLADKTADGQAKQVVRRVCHRQSAQGRDQYRPAGAALAGGRGLGGRGQVHREQVVDLGCA